MHFIALKQKKITPINVLLLLLSHLLHLFFTLNFIVVLVDEGARIFLAPGRRVPYIAIPLSYATDIKTSRIFCHLSDIFPREVCKFLPCKEKGLC